MPLIVTGAQLRAIGGKGALRTDDVAAALNLYAPAFGLDTPRRLAHFLAQVSHESGGFRFYREVWGPTPAQRGYEGRHDLGNVVAGDGKRFMGRCPLQCTGRTNYAAFTAWCRQRYPDCPDFVAEPWRLEETRWGVLAAIWFWDTRGLNKLADADDLLGITHKVNGGENGLADRRYRYGLAVRALATAAPPVPRPVNDNVGRPALRKGAKGDAVKALQRALGISPDGDFGNLTELALIAFQRAHGLLPDGRCGGLTWAALDAAAVPKAA